MTSAKECKNNLK